MADEGAQRFTVGLPGEVHDNVLEVLAQGAEEHVQLGGTGGFQRLVSVGVGKNAQAVVGAGESAVDQRGVEAAQMTQGIAEVKRTLQPQQREAVATGQAKVEQQGLLAALLHHHGHVIGEQGTVGTALHAVHHGKPAQLRVGSDGGQAFAQAPHQSGDFAGTRAIGDKIPRTGAHRIEHQLIVHAVAESNDRQHRLGFQRTFDQRALRHDMLAIETDEDQIGEGYIDQREQFVEAAGTCADDLAEWREGALQPFQIGAVAGDGEEGLTEILVHCDNPLRLSKLPFSRKNMR